jgi:transposase-like protein
MVQRSGRVIACTVPNVAQATIMPIVKERVLPRSMIYTDEYEIYNRLGEAGYGHRRVYHKEHVYVAGSATTNAIEGFFGLVKNGIRGVYHSVSRKHLQGYLNEYAFRDNLRDGETPIFWAILDRVERARLAAS